MRDPFSEFWSLNFLLLLQFIIETGVNEDGEEQLLIPAALQIRKVDEDRLPNASSNALLFGRQYSSSQSFSLRTFHSVQMSVWEKYGSDSIYFYKDYVHFKHDGLPVWIEAKHKHSVIQLTIAVSAELLPRYTLEILKNKCGKIIGEFFEQVIFQTILMNNPKDIVVSKMVMSWEAMKKGKDVSYSYQDVMNHCKKGCMFIHKILLLDNGTIISDVVDSLVTSQEIKVTFV